MIVMNETPAIDVAAAVFRKNDKVLVARRARGQHLEYKWEFPGGKVEKNETPEECLHRELKEELGVLVEVGEYIGESLFNYAEKNIRLLAYQVELLSGDFSLTVHDEINWVKIKDLASVDLAEADIPIALTLQKQIMYQADPNRVFYETHSQTYYNRTCGIDPASFLRPITIHLEKGSHILDIGCGSGRDLLWLKRKGFKPTGFERSAGLADLARHHSGCPVIEGDFLSYDFSKLQFDALALIGALVHLQHTELPLAVSRISRAAKTGGLLHLSLKEGEGVFHHADGRIFTLWQSQNLETIFRHEGFKIIDFSRNISPLNHADVWLGYLLKKEQ